MEKLKQQAKLINLGQLLINELEGEPGADTLSRWMAHYIAEKISAVEKAKSAEKQKLKKECFDLILKLWEHRSELPSGSRPLQNFEAILTVLHNISPDENKPYYYNRPRRDERQQIEMDQLDEKSGGQWLEIMQAADRAARVWIEHALKKAGDSAQDDNTRKWIESISAVNPSAPDVGIITNIIECMPLFDLDDEDDNGADYDVELLKTRIADLKKFEKLNKYLLDDYEQQLKKITVGKP
jgi:hypothetical protein